MVASLKNNKTEHILKVRDLKKHFILKKGFSFSKSPVVRAVDGISFELRKGQNLGVVGESGCGKTTVGRSILRLTEPTSGQIRFNGRDITRIGSKDLKSLRPKMQFMFQDPYSSLDPRMSIRRILKEPVDNFFKNLNRGQKQDLIIESIMKVGLQPDHLKRYPHEFSGGQRQRIALARTLISNPELIICDEPVSALDVSIQAQVIKLLKKLQSELGLSIIFISHDLAVVEFLCDPIAVMYLGRIVEISPKNDLYKNPLHPYTEALLSAVPIPDPKLERKRVRRILTGDVPSPLNVPKGCAFHPRCPLVIEKCRHERPELAHVKDTHEVACWVKGKN